MASAEVLIAALAITADDPSPNDLAVLDPDERLRAQRMHPAVRRRFVVARAELRRLVAAKLGRSADTVRLRQLPNGRVETHGLRLSVAHTRGVALAAAADVPVGVDVEPSTGRANLRRLPPGWLTAGEEASLADLPEDAWRHAAVRFWVVKEAALKARGVGLAGGLGTGEVRQPSDMVCAAKDLDAVARVHGCPIVCAGTPGPWSYHMFLAAPGFVGAAVVGAESFTMRLATTASSTGRILEETK